MLCFVQDVDSVFWEAYLIGSGVNLFQIYTFNYLFVMVGWVFKCVRYLRGFWPFNVHLGPSGGLEKVGNERLACSGVPSLSKSDGAGGSLGGGSRVLRVPWTVGSCSAGKWINRICGEHCLSVFLVVIKDSVHLRNVKKGEDQILWKLFLYLEVLSVWPRQPLWLVSSRRVFQLTCKVILFFPQDLILPNGGTPAGTK